MAFRILLVKESRMGEQRVALVPQDVKRLVEQGHQIFVESNAGFSAGFSDQDYQHAGAMIRVVHGNDLSNFQGLFSGIDVVVRVKRASYQRERLENQSMAAGTRIIGALDPFEKDSLHIAEYHQQKLKAYSIDQLRLAADSPINILASMSRIAGKLAIIEAAKLARRHVENVLIIGFGTLGQAALKQAKAMNFQAYVAVRDESQARRVEASQGIAVMLNPHDSLHDQQSRLQPVLSSSDMVIACARQANRKAPLLITHAMMNQMHAGSVIVDTALSEGGNVEGSAHDKTIVHESGVIITNNSAYPKSSPTLASPYWSQAVYGVVQGIAAGDFFFEQCVIG